MSLRSTAISLLAAARADSSQSLDDCLSALSQAIAASAPADDIASTLAVLRDARDAMQVRRAQLLQSLVEAEKSLLYTGDPPSESPSWEVAG